MNALAMCFGFNVIVHCVDQPSLANVFNEPIGSVPTIHLSFHLDSHYNSIRRGDDPIIKGTLPLNEYEIGHDLDKVKLLMENKNDIVEDEEKEVSDDIVKFALKSI